MIDVDKQVELSPQAVAEKVARYLRECHPDGVNIEVDPDGIVKGEFEWRVRVRPSQEPQGPMEYYEALTEVEMKLDEQEHLNVFLVPSDPDSPLAAETRPGGDDNRAGLNRPAHKLKHRLQVTKQD
jgi:hypothetical protein